MNGPMTLIYQKNNKTIITIILMMLLISLSAWSSLSFATDIQKNATENAAEENIAENVDENHNDDKPTTNANSEKPHSLLQRIIDSYVSSANTDTTLKHLLDAKMYLSAAEHDLLIKHDKQDAHDNIQNALHFLSEALEVASPGVKTNVQALMQELKQLQKKTDESERAGKENEVDTLLMEAQTSLQKASKIASMDEKPEITRIDAAIQALRQKIEHINLKEDYKNSLHNLNTIIHSL